MRLNKIYISAFGGLKDFTLNLSDGLNVVYGNNEDGKSTVAAFIKSMFYGTGRNSKILADSVRQKYTPWDGSTMAGRIYFENEGKNYCLEREFRKSDSTDRILLTDTDLGKEIDATDNIGEHFFGMSAAAFERSLFIGNGDFIKDGAAAGEINAKLSNIAVTGNEDTSYQKIQKALCDAKEKIISKSGRAGSYAKDLQLYEELKQRLSRADDDARKKSQLHESIEISRAQYETLYKKYLSLKGIIDQENDLKNREKLAEYLETKRQLDTVNADLCLPDNTTLDESFIKKVNFGIAKYERMQDRCKELQSDIEKIKESIELQNQNSPESAKKQIEELSQKVNSLSLKIEELTNREQTIHTSLKSAEQNLADAKGKRSAVNPTLLVVSAVLVITAVVCALLLSKLVAIGIGATALLTLVLSFVLKPQNKSRIASVQAEITKLNNDLAETRTNKNLIQEDINNSNARINSLSSVLNTDAAIKAQRQSDMNDKLISLEDEQKKRDAALDEVKEYLSNFDNVNTVEEIKELLNSLEIKTQNQKQLKLQLSYLSRDLGNIGYDEAAQKLAAIQDGTNVNSADIEAAKTEFEVVGEKLSQLKEDITVNLTELKTSFRHSENPEDVQRELDAVKEKLASKKEFCDTIDIALSVLQDSFNEVRSGFGSELEQQTQSIFSSLTDGKYKSVTVSDGLQMSVEQTAVFGTRDLDFLSLGATHQAYLSLRLAITSLISKENPLPVFLDDSLSQYDDSRTEKAMKFLKIFCQNSQGILFTCHNSICEIAKKQGIDIIKPYN